MYDLDAFTDQDIPQNRHIGNHGRQNALVVASANRKIVDFEPVGHVSDALSVAVGVCNYNYLKIRQTGASQFKSI